MKTNMLLKEDVMIVLADKMFLLFDPNVSKKILKAASNFAETNFFPSVVSSYVVLAHFLRVCYKNNEQLL